MTKVLCAPAQNWDRVLRQHAVNNQVSTNMQHHHQPSQPRGTRHEPGHQPSRSHVHTFVQHRLFTWLHPLTRWSCQPISPQIQSISSNQSHIKSIKHRSINQSAHRQSKSQSKSRSKQQLDTSVAADYCVDLLDQRSRPAVGCTTAMRPKGGGAGGDEVTVDNVWVNAEDGSGRRYVFNGECNAVQGRLFGVAQINQETTCHGLRRCC
jgi:hypothetical protein